MIQKCRKDFPIPPPVNHSDFHETKEHVRIVRSDLDSFPSMRETRESNRRIECDVPEESYHREHRYFAETLPDSDSGSGRPDGVATAERAPRRLAVRSVILRRTFNRRDADGAVSEKDDDQQERRWNHGYGLGRRE